MNFNRALLFMILSKVTESYWSGIAYAVCGLIFLLVALFEGENNERTKGNKI